MILASKNFVRLLFITVTAVLVASCSDVEKEEQPKAGPDAIITITATEADMGANYQVTYTLNVPDNVSSDMVVGYVVGAGSTATSPTFSSVDQVTMASGSSSTSFTATVPKADSQQMLILEFAAPDGSNMASGSESIAINIPALIPVTITATEADMGANYQVTYTLNVPDALSSDLMVSYVTGTGSTSTSPAFSSPSPVTMASGSTSTSFTATVAKEDSQQTLILEFTDSDGYIIASGSESIATNIPALLIPVIIIATGKDMGVDFQVTYTLNVLDASSSDLMFNYVLASGSTAIPTFSSPSPVTMASGSSSTSFTATVAKEDSQLALILEFTTPATHMASGLGSITTNIPALESSALSTIKPLFQSFTVASGRFFLILVVA